MHIVLVEPEIPQNTGNIARTCAATGCTLDLVEPLGFKLEDKYLKRAGLDYWPMVEVRVHASFEALLKFYPAASFFYATTKAPHDYASVAYPQDAFLVFGRESRGLPENLLSCVYDRCIRIPMVEGARSLNLSNSVAVIVYEALRQQGFPAMRSAGQLTGREEPGAPWLDYL